MFYYIDAEGGLLTSSYPLNDDDSLTPLREPKTWEVYDQTSRDWTWETFDKHGVAVVLNSNGERLNEDGHPVDRDGNVI